MSTTAAKSEEATEGGDLGEQIIEVMLETHAAYADSQHRSGSRQQRVYGLIFADLPERLGVGLLSRRDDVEVRKVGRAGYRVPVINDTLYFPWRPPGGARPEDVHFGGSLSRERLWHVRRESDALPLFAVEGDDLVSDHPADPEMAGSLAELLAAGEHLSVVIIAMTSSSHQADRIEWGPASLNADGMLVWEPELLWDSTSGTGPADTGGSSFDSGQPPQPPVSPRVLPGQPASDG